MKRKNMERLAAGLVAAAMIASYTAVMPPAQVSAEADKAADEALYASVLDEYLETVIPGKAVIGEEYNGRNYSDEWVFTTMDPSSYGYQFYDLDWDGTDELFVLNCRDPYQVKVMEIYTIVNGVPKQIATGGARWDYYVVNAENVLGSQGASSATETNYTFYHLVNGSLIAFQNYINDTGTWYFASGDGCEGKSEAEMQVIPESEVYNDLDTMGGMEMLIFDEENYLFSDYQVSHAAAAPTEIVTESTTASTSSPDSGDHKCGDDAYWELDAATGTLTIRGTGALYDQGVVGYDDSFSPWFYAAPDGGYRCDVKKLVVEEGITAIGECAFCFATKLESVVLPESLTEIRKLAFQSCPALNEITIPKGVQTIGADALGYEGNDGMVKEGFTIYGYEMSAADQYARDNGISFVALDTVEEIPEAMLTEEEQADLWFTDHHVGIAELEGDWSIWTPSEDIDKVTELALFDYYYGHTGISFVTETYANLGNPKEIVEAGKKSRDITTSASEVMYYQALLSILYHVDEDDLSELEAAYYTEALQDVVDVMKDIDTMNGVQDAISSFQKAAKAIENAKTGDEVQSIVKGIDNDPFKIADLPVKDINGNNLDLGAADVLGYLTDLQEIKADQVRSNSEILACIVCFKAFDGLQESNKVILEEMDETSTGNETFQKAIGHVHDSLTTMDFRAFVSDYYLTEMANTAKESLDSRLSATLGRITLKLLQTVDTYHILDAFSTTGVIVDRMFDSMNQTEQKIYAIGKLVCYGEIIDSLRVVGDGYEKALLDSHSFNDAERYHDVITLYYRALSSYCYFGDAFLDLFISTYYAVDMKESKSNGLFSGIGVGELLFRYGLVEIEEHHAGDYLDNVFGLSDGDISSWYQETVALQISLKYLKERYDRPICCLRMTEDEIKEQVKSTLESALENAKRYLSEHAQKWRTAFIGCPVETCIYSEDGTLIARVQEGDVEVLEPELYQGIICYRLEEEQSGREGEDYGTLLMVPADHTYTVTALDNCEVMIQYADSDDLSAITLAREEWDTGVKEMAKGDTIDSNSALTQSTGHLSPLWMKGIVIGVAVIVVGIGALVVFRRKRE